MKGVALNGAWAALLTALFAAAAAGFSAPPEQKGNAGMSALQDRTAGSPEGALFDEKCGMCHRQFGMGTVLLARRVEKGTEMLEKRDDLAADYVRKSVRMGIGNMPRIGRGEVSDPQLEAIARYLAKGRP
jgi:mono/diheme cytochrome c family protein